MGSPIFTDRADAGARLARLVVAYHFSDPVVVGLPRGGVPVAAVVARTLRCPLDVIVVRKLGVPGHDELGFGAISEAEVRVLNDDIVTAEGLTAEVIAHVEKVERATLRQRLTTIRTTHPPVPLTGKTAIIVDDGIATGIDARAACRVARARGAAHVVLAVPVAPQGWQSRLAGEADTFVAVSEPVEFWGVGQFYSDFAQVDDAAVLACLSGG